MSSPDPLPVAGTWRRLYEEDPIGDEKGADYKTLVLWTQARDSGIYVDVRLPEGSPGRSLEAAREAGIRPRPTALTAIGFDGSAKARLVERLDVMLRQKSFAGVIVFKEGDTTTGEALRGDAVLASLVEKGGFGSISLCTCFWRRDTDYQPPTGGLDVGVCASEPRNADGSITLRETGDDASYAEGWLRLPGAENGPFMALELLSENGMKGARVGYWVRVGRRFAYAVGRPVSAEANKKLLCVNNSHFLKDSVGKSLSEAARELSSDSDEILDLVGSYVGLTGEIDQNGKWMIKCSTNPELVGCLLVGEPRKDDLCCSQLKLIQTGGETGEGGELEQFISRDGATSVRRRWKISEMTGCSLPVE